MTTETETETETDTDTVSSDATLRHAGLQALREALPGMIPAGDIDLRDGRLGQEMVELGLVSVWGQLWSREGLSKRDRSLVTVALLIALRADVELKTHARVAITNGVTEDELAEVLYHAAGYTGFPAAIAARESVRDALGR